VMSTQTSNQYENFQEFLDEVQYSKNGVKRYEWIFGEGYLSTGGLETTKQIIPYLELKKGDRVLDVGCGLGGHDFYMAENYGAVIDAIDLSKNMMSVALKHFAKKPKIADNIKFRICDVTATEFKNNYYDVIYSRDALLHIKQKPELFRKFFQWLKPGGRLVFTDYCRGETNSSEEFERYVKQRDYTLIKVKEYEELMKSCGFVNVLAEDINDKFEESLNRELKKLYSGRKEFLQLFNIEDYEDLEEGWLAKVKRAKDGHQTWGLFRAQKPL
jgi:phosphoethanolamine N-methyltransferase